MAAQYAFVMKDMTKSFPGAQKPVLNNINLQFYHGAKIGIVGPNGAGKSTLMKIMAGIDKDFQGEAWPGDMSRGALVARAFRAKQADESHRARLRVEIGRLRRALRTLAEVSATKRGFALVPRQAGEVVLLAPPVEEKHAAMLAFLADGESWSSSALALASGASPRTVQRALEALATEGKIQSYGRGRARRRRGWRGGDPSGRRLSGPLAGT